MLSRFWTEPLNEQRQQFPGCEIQTRDGAVQWWLSACLHGLCWDWALVIILVLMQSELVIVSHKMVVYPGLLRFIDAGVIFSGFDPHGDRDLCPQPQIWWSGYLNVIPHIPWPYQLKTGNGKSIFLGSSCVSSWNAKNLYIYITLALGSAVSVSLWYCSLYIAIESQERIFSAFTLASMPAFSNLISILFVHTVTRLWRPLHGLVSRPN